MTAPPLAPPFDETRPKLVWRPARETRRPLPAALVADVRRPEGPHWRALLWLLVAVTIACAATSTANGVRAFRPPRVPTSQSGPAARPMGRGAG